MIKNYNHKYHEPILKKNDNDFSFRILIAFIFIIILFIILLVKTFILQIVFYNKYSNKSDFNRITTISIPAIRGEIIDTNGILLATNYPALSLEITENKLENPIKQVIEELKNYVNITPEDIKRYNHLKFQYSRYESIPLKLKISIEEASKLASNLYKFPGININSRIFREYKYPKIMAHVIGYIGRISENDKKKLKEDNKLILYHGSTHIGKTGLEKFYELQLHGQPGIKEIEKDAKGNIVKVLRNIPAKKGHTIQLSIDIKLEQKIMKIMDNKKGAVIAINPQNGEVLAFVSSPSFNPNLFIDGIDYDNWNYLNNNSEKPLINRVSQGLYPPGSTLKPFIGIAALQSKTISTHSIIYSPGFWTIPGSKHKFRDVNKKGYQYINLAKAIQVSSDTFFYQLGYMMGIDNISKYIKYFGFGEKTGIDLPNEYKGTLPSKEWKIKRFKNQNHLLQKWDIADTISISIGQGYNAYTPLQLAQATAILANNGIVYSPHIVKKIIDYNNNIVNLMYNAPKQKIQINQEYFTYIKNAMQQVVKNGTAYKISQNLKYSLAGKTGTSQVIKIKQGSKYNANNILEKHRDHALFIGFAPVDAPKIAIAVVIENGGWGINAGIIARDIIDYYLIDILANKNSK